MAFSLLVVGGVLTGLASARAGDLPVLRELIGRSVRGRPIYAYGLGPPGGRPVVVVGCTDGDEPAGMAIVAALRKLQPPIGVDLWLIPTINPDGVAAGTTGNAHGVDLNRNFPYAWRHLGGKGHFDSGPRPLSEPETRALHRFLLRVKPRLSIWFHQPLALVDDSQGSRRLERTFGGLVGLPLRPLTDYPGSITNWANHRFPRTTAFVTELPPGRLTHPGALRYARAILAVGRQGRHFAPRAKITPAYVSADTRRMDEAGPDELREELAAAEATEKQLSAERRRLHHQIDYGFANAATLAREREVSDERRRLHQRIDSLRERLRARGALAGSDSKPAAPDPSPSSAFSEWSGVAPEIVAAEAAYEELEP